MTTSIGVTKNFRLKANPNRLILIPTNVETSPSIPFFSSDPPAFPCNHPMSNVRCKRHNRPSHSSSSVLFQVVRLGQINKDEQRRARIISASAAAAAAAAAQKAKTKRLAPLSTSSTVSTICCHHNHSKATKTNLQ